MNKNTWIAIAVAIFVVGFFLFGGTIVNLFNPSDSQNTTQTMNDTTNTADINQPPAGLIVQDKTVGTGAEATAGTLVTVNYVGSFTDGTKFDASADHGKPFQFVLGAGQVIPGWDQGVAGMKVGGSRILVVPPSLVRNNPLRVAANKISGSSG